MAAVAVAGLLSSAAAENERIVRDYDRYTIKAPSDWSVGYPAVIKALGPLKEKRGLDYGCASGKFSRSLGALGASVIGVDSSPQKLETAKKSPAKNVEYRCIQGGHLQFIEADSLDFVVANFVLAELVSKDEITTVMRQVRRVLKPGGKFVILNFNWEAVNGKEFLCYRFDAYPDLNSGQKVRLTLLSEEPVRIESTFWSQADYFSMLKQSGFEKVRLDHPLAEDATVVWKGEDKIPLYLLLVAEK